MTKDELSRAILNAAQAVYSTRDKGGYEATAAAQRHAALLREYQERFGQGSPQAATPVPVASPSGVPWSVDRCDAQGRLIPGR